MSKHGLGRKTLALFPLFNVCRNIRHRNKLKVSQDVVEDLIINDLMIETVLTEPLTLSGVPYAHQILINDFARLRGIFAKTDIEYEKEIASLVPTIAPRRMRYINDIIN